MRVTRTWFLCMWCAVLACGCGDDDDSKKKTALDAGETQLPDKTAGKGCKSDDDCPNGKCMRDLMVGSMTEARKAPGGYCTASCDTDSQCGNQGECSVGAGQDRGLCLGMCNSQADCRDGYACVGATAGFFNGAGSCQPMQRPDELGDRVAGRECASDGDCLGGTCASASPLGAPYPSNYCTGRCWEDAHCGEGGVCLTQAASADAGWCLEGCGSDADCGRRGYRCMQLKSGFNACFPAPDALPDETSGKACASDTECGGVVGACANELPYRTFSAYENIDAPGGYCTSTCSLDSECGEGGVCVSRGPKGGMCLKTCLERSDCRDGYGCEPHGRDLNFEARVCVPRTE